jgi:hypothetical protein
MGLFKFSAQKEFNLENAIERIDRSGLPDFRFMKNNLLDDAIDDLVSGAKAIKK